jgi:peptide deformylase
MVETMRSARGVGLAATQVGDERRVIVLDVPEDDDGDDEGEGERRIHLTLVNPEIISSEGDTKFEEGCLSVPGFTADVKRAATINVKALDREGKQVKFTAHDLLSIAIQHEIDHLDGILFIDRLSRLKRELLKRKIKKVLEDERMRL